MRKQMIENAAFEVATQVRAVEDSLESTLIEIAELQSRMLRARAVAGIGVATGQDALTEVANSLQALVQARGSIGAAHAALRDAKQSIPGLRTVAFGDGEECPPTKGSIAELRIVA